MIIAFLRAYIKAAALKREHKRIDWTLSYSDKMAHARRMHRAQIELGAAGIALGFPPRKRKG